MVNPGDHDAGLRDLLSGLGNRAITYISNPGNAGDALIAAATYQLFDALGLSYSVIPYTSQFSADWRDKVVIYAGGGNLVTQSKSNACRRVLRESHEEAELVVLLPHTVTGNEDLLGSLGGNTHLFCRERRSYEHVKQHARRANVHLAHDMALSLDVGVIRKATARSLGVRARRGLSALRDEILFTCTRSERPGTIDCFRTDKERTELSLPRGNRDLAKLFKREPLGPTVAREVTRRVLRFLDRYGAVRTNRLHVCIGAALLGKDVFFYPNNYFKNREVFDFSIADRFGNVAWRDEPDVTGGIPGSTV